MKTVWILPFATLLALAGCAPQGDTGAESDVAGASATLTVEQCDAQLDSCLDSPLAWLLGWACAGQHDQCIATSDRPTPVRDAIYDAQMCAEEASVCRDGANAVERVVCGVEEAECLASVLGVDIDVDATVEGAVECAADAAGCISNAEVVGDLGNCGTDLVDCTVEEAAEVVDGLIPDAVTEVIGSVLTCSEELDACVGAAETPADLVGCGEDNVQCVSDVFGLTLPDVPAEELTDCATSATECTLEARSVSDVQQCTDELRECNQAAVQSVPNPICFFFPFLCAN